MDDSRMRAGRRPFSKRRRTKGANHPDHRFSKSDPMVMTPQASADDQRPRYSTSADDGLGLTVRKRSPRVFGDFRGSSLAEESFEKEGEPSNSAENDKDRQEPRFVHDTIRGDTIRSERRARTETTVRASIAFAGPSSDIDR